MKLALVQDFLTGFAGGEQVLLALHELYPDAPIYTSLYNSEKTPQFKDAQVTSSYLQKLPASVRKQQLAIPLMPQAFESFDLKEFDVVISVGGGLSKGVITQPNQVHISYCHTPMRYIWNLGGDQRTDGWLKSWAAHKLRIWDVVSSERVDHFIANSQTVAARIAKIYRASSTVIYPPVDIQRFQLSTAEPADYFLSVCRLVDYKRVDLIIQAIQKTAKKLKIVGEGPERRKLEKLAGNNPNIQFLGRVADSELQSLYAGAQAFIIASEEDFGLVPVEAMAVGRPVIAFAKGGATESVITGKTGAFFAEQTVESLVEVMENFVSQDFSPTDCRSRAEQFDKDSFKQKMEQFVASVG